MGPSPPWPPLTLQRKREAVSAVYELKPVPKGVDPMGGALGNAWAPESGH